MSAYINSEKIQAFVTAVEKKKNYKAEPGFIMRHLVEEVGELSAELYKYEKLVKITCDSVIPERLLARKKVAAELIDVISLANYMASVMHIDLNEAFPARIEAVAKQYDVEIPEGCL